MHPPERNDSTMYTGTMNQSPSFSSVAFKSSFSLSSGDGEKHKKGQQSPYLKRVRVALQKALAKMEPYQHPQNTRPTIKMKSTSKKHRAMVRPHVELGTAPIETENIEDIQKIRPFHTTTTSTNENSSLDANTGKNDGNAVKYSSKLSYGSTKRPSSTPNRVAIRESCLIESTSNSVRISFLFKAQAKAQTNSATSDPLETSILFQWMRFLMRQEQHTLLRKTPLEGYSVTFLITHKHVATHGLEAVQDCIMSFCERIDKECSDIKLQVNAQARYVTTEYCKAFNQTD